MKSPPRRLRSAAWFDDPAHAVETAIYLERYFNSGLTAQELRAGRPIIGIAQTGSDLAPCNRHHLQLAQRVRDGIRDAGGVPFEFPVHTIHEMSRRPTAALDRNLAYLCLVEILFGYPLDGVVLTTGCDKTTPAALMAAATADIPAIVLSGGPMLNGWADGRRAGSGSAIWSGRDQLKTGAIDFEQFMALTGASAPSPGHCNTMGTALTMNSLAEALGMSLPGCAAIPAPHRERGQIAYQTGRRIVEMVWEDLKPSRILTPAAFRNAIRVCTAIGGSTNATIHLQAIAERVGIDLPLEDWTSFGENIALIVNCQPAGEYLGEDFHRAGGIPAVLGELLRAQVLEGDALTVTGRTIGVEHAQSRSADTNVIRTYTNPLRERAGFIVLRGNFFRSALFKASVLTESFRRRYLENPEHPGVLRARAVVFEGPEDYHRRIDDPALAIDEDCMLVIRGCGPLGYPGSAEVVNMSPPDYLLKRGIDMLPCLGDGRQSGTSASPSILHVSPESAAGGDLALVRTGDRIEVDFARRYVTLQIDAEEFRRRRAEVARQPLRDRTPWQTLFRRHVRQLDEGAGLDLGQAHRRVVRNDDPPRHSH